MAALLVTPSDDQLPVSEKTPPSTISLSMRGMVPLSSQPREAASATSNAARRAPRAPGKLRVFIVGDDPGWAVCGRETSGEESTGSHPAAHPPRPGGYATA